MLTHSVLIIFIVMYTAVVYYVLLLTMYLSTQLTMLTVLTVFV